MAFLILPNICNQGIMTSASSLPLSTHDLEIYQDPGQRSDRENNSGARPDYMADGGRQFAEARIAEEMWYVTS